MNRKAGMETRDFEVYETVLGLSGMEVIFL